MSAQLSLLVTVCVACAAAVGEGLVPFVIPARANPESLIALPAGRPIPTRGERIVARDGHFFAGGRRVRIWGVNLCFGANFPAHADAEQIAERLAAAGVNGVRFHHMDFTSFPNGIWDRANPRELSAEALDRLDYLIDRLARRGICANLNLHVSRTHSRVLKLPDANKLPRYDKMVDIFTPALIEAHRKYARDLLTHVNAYRKVRYADDPAVAFVEISNEDSLFMWDAEETLRTLPPYYAKILQGRYVAWLKARYGSAAKLREAWGKGVAPLGENLLVDGKLRRLGEAAAGAKRWRLQGHAGCAAKAVATAEGVRVEIARADQTGWHIQFSQSGLAVKGGQYYTLGFRARAEKPRPISCNVGQAHEPWGMLGLSRRADLTEKWQPVRAGFVATADDENARVCLQLGGSDVAVELADVELRLGGRDGLRADESLRSGNVALFAQGETEARLLDRWRFLAETEKAYFDQMRSFIRKDLECGALVTGTIVFGPCGLYAQSGMDYLDGHAYWQHPRFPGRPWDPGNWTVEQKAMTDHPGVSPLFRLAAQRLAGKPYTVSEYNHPAPNDFQAECVPMVASFAAAQDWDGVWLFAYSHRTDDWNRKHFTSFFDIDGNPAKWGFAAAGAVIFRQAGIGPLPAAKVVPLAEGPDVLGLLAAAHVKHGRNLFAAAAEKAGLRWQDVLRVRVGVDLTGKASMLKAASEAVGRISWRRGRRGRDGNAATFSSYEAVGPRAHVWIGYLAQPAIGIDTFVAHAPGGQPPFAVITEAALDGKALNDSAKILIAACGRCENTNMVFTKDRRSVGRNWGGPPVRIEPVRATLCSSWIQDPQRRCQALAPDGRAARKVEISQSSSGGRCLELYPRHRTMWYLLTRK